MAEEFHLIDLVSQAVAVENLLHEKSESEKLDWLSLNGKVSQMEKKFAEWPNTYIFVSKTGLQCAFIFKDGGFYFVGPQS